jgi:hypothetical protein
MILRHPSASHVSSNRIQLFCFFTRHTKRRFRLRASSMNFPTRQHGMASAKFMTPKVQQHGMGISGSTREDNF